MLKLVFRMILKLRIIMFQQFFCTITILIKVVAGAGICEFDAIFKYNQIIPLLYSFSIYICTHFLKNGLFAAGISNNKKCAAVLIQPI